MSSDACVGGVQVGSDILGYGSSGTIVFDGSLDGRPVAIKRILAQFYDLARHEIGALILSDEHPNVVRPSPLLPLITTMSTTVTTCFAAPEAECRYSHSMLVKLSSPASKSEKCLASASR